MAQSILTPTIIAKEALMQLENNLVLGNLVYRGYKKEFVKIGDEVTIRKPVRFVATDGATISVQDVEEKSTSLKIDKRLILAWKFSSEELTLSIEEYSKRYIQPAVGALQQSIDSAIADLYIEVPNAVGTAGSAPATFAELGLAGEMLDNFATPEKGRSLVLDPTARWKLADAFKGFYQPTMVERFLKEASLGRVGGFDIFGDQNIKKHTKGVATGTPLTNGADQVGASIITDGWTVSTVGILKKGDVITFAGTYAVNPISKQSTGVLRHFVVTADVDSDAGGNATIPISPTAVLTGNYQNVSAAIADGSAIVTLADHTANLAFHKNAIALVNVPIELPDGAAFKAQETHNGLSVRVVKDYDITNDQDIIRIDIMFGTKVIYPDLAVRLLG